MQDAFSNSRFLSPRQHTPTQLDIADMNGKTLLAAACAISLACGYIAGNAGNAAARKSDSEPSAQARANRPASRDSRPRISEESSLLDSLLGGRPIAEIPASELAALIARLSKYDPSMTPLARSKQSYQLQLLLAKLSPADLDGLATAIHSDEDLKEDSTLIYVLAALAGKDKERALAWLSSKESDSRAYAAVIGSIAKDDPHAAAAILRDTALKEGNTSYQLWSASYTIGQSMAMLGTDPLLAYLDTLPNQQQSTLISNCFQHLPKGEHIKFLDEIQRRSKNGNISGFSINQLFSTLLSSDQAAAKEWLSKLPDSNEKNSIRTYAAIDLFENGRSEAAATWLREAIAATPGKEKETLGGIIQALSTNKPEAIAHVTRLLPEGVEFTAKDLEQYAQNSLYNGTGGLTALASAVSNPDEKARFVATALGNISPASGLSQRFNANDFEILSRQIAAMGFTGDNAALVTRALEMARNAKAGGN